MPKPRPQPDGDHDHGPDDRPAKSARVAWMDETRAAIFELARDGGSRHLASAETAVRVLEWLESEREPDWIKLVPDGRSMRVKWSEGDRGAILTIANGQLDNVRRMRGDTYGPLLKLRKQPLDTLRAVVMELDSCRRT